MRGINDNAPSVPCGRGESFSRNPALTRRHCHTPSPRGSSRPALRHRREGVIASFFEPLEREKMIKSLTQNIKNVPFVPLPLIETLIDSLVQRVGARSARASPAARDRYRLSAAVTTRARTILT